MAAVTAGGPFQSMGAGLEDTDAHDWRGQVWGLADTSTPYNAVPHTWMRKARDIRVNQTHSANAEGHTFSSWAKIDLVTASLLLAC